MVNWCCAKGSGRSCNLREKRHFISPPYEDEWGLVWTLKWFTGGLRIRVCQQNMRRRVKRRQNGGGKLKVGVSCKGKPLASERAFVYKRLKCILRSCQREISLSSLENAPRSWWASKQCCVISTFREKKCKFPFLLWLRSFSVLCS